MDGFSHSDIKALQSLLSVENEDSDSDGDLDQKGKYKLGPGHIGPPKDSKTMGISPHESLKPVGHDIWHQSEITTSQITEVLDSRAQPEYEIKFKQAVTTEDVFLGVSTRNYRLILIPGWDLRHLHRHPISTPPANPSLSGSKFLYSKMARGYINSRVKFENDPRTRRCELLTSQRFPNVF
ncbi:protein PIH1D3 isoform X2 [Fopius arisanus]|uniref:Protein PIH1D3 isoform X2 n=1 Tax=Fopius arisanus TaxID=64838 RepID=A0A9R1T496_9HYME|nr:PREDICTED: protein PIH1D3 isoform X2 [Fopius arisanus]